MITSLWTAAAARARLLPALALAALVGAAPAAAETPPSRAELDAFARDQLEAAILLFHRHFRHPTTGQYLDSVDLRNDPQRERLSSIAATGIGLISLALGDRIGLLDDAEAAAETTLEHLLNDDPTRPFFMDRSKNGWFRHWVDVETGRPPGDNPEKFSTIDTAILAAGAAIVGKYFQDKHAQAGQPEPRAHRLAAQLLGSVRWSSAIQDVARGATHLVFYGPEERPSPRMIYTIPFDEYALLPCMCMQAEELAGVEGPAMRLWERHYAVASEIAQRDYRGLSVLAKRSGGYVSHFTHQFAFYLCSGFQESPGFEEELTELAAADRLWFDAARDDARRSGAPGAFPSHLWGLGAGSELVWNAAGDSIERTRYGVASLGRNPNHMASPAIMAGFLPVDDMTNEDRILSELHTLYSRGECRYAHAGLEFLWRCSARDPDMPVNRVQGIDFSTYMLGLASAVDEVGLDFFKRYAY